MPTYQYACTACEHQFETVQAFSDASLTECPECGGRLRKLYGSIGVVFKGTGFYRTDSRAGGKAEAAVPAGSSSSDSGPSKSESKSGSNSGSSSAAKSESSSSSSTSKSDSSSSSSSKPSGGTTSSSAKAS